MSTYEYVGEELDLFSHAKNWKRYFASKLRPYVRGRVLEVGAGLGETTAHLVNNSVTNWVGLEPDAALAKRFADRVMTLPMPRRFSSCVGTVTSLDADEGFDCLLYIDVLEHIENDREELFHAARLLRPHGALVVLSPAHQFLYSRFDEALGHFRRYDRKSLRSVGPSSLVLEKLICLDSIGFFASLANKMLLHQSMPTLRQISAWDRLMVPISRFVDPLLLFRAGKSIIGVCRKPPSA